MTACKPHRPRLRNSTCTIPARFLCGVALAAISALGGIANALDRPRTIDAANVFKNVGIYMVTYGPNSLGLPVGYVADFCSGVLLSPHVFMTAAHCAQWNVNGVAPFVRMVVSFSPDNPTDPATWIDITQHMVHPTWPGKNCSITAPVEPPPCAPGADYSTVSDIGLAILSRPVTVTMPAALPSVDRLASAYGSRVTMVGYGCSNEREFLRNSSTSTLSSVTDYRAFYNVDPGSVCRGDSGGPSFLGDAVMSIHSAHDGTLNNDARVDTASALNWIKGVVQSVDPPVNINQHGITGSWYQPATSGQGLEIEIFADLAAPGEGVVQASWFTFDGVVGGPERQRWYTLGGSVASGETSARLAIYQNVGGNFNGAPITRANQVGSATLRFADCDHSALDYAFTDGSGRAGSIELTRLTRNITCTSTGAPPVNADFAFSGNWYDPAVSGQGITVEINPLSPVAFLAWYTYAPGGAAAGEAGQRWYTGQSGYSAGARTLAMTLYETTGGRFDAPSPSPASTVSVGTATLAYQSCTAATLSFVFTGGSSTGASGTIMLRRIGSVPPGCAI